MAKTISIFNQKGGVGKSTTASNLMAELTRSGYKVLGIDIDAQGHLSKFCGIDTEGKTRLRSCWPAKRRSLKPSNTLNTVTFYRATDICSLF